MRPRRLAFCLAAALAAACVSASAAPPPPASPAPAEWTRREQRRLVRYDVSIPDPARKWVEVAMSVERPGGLRSELALPAWAPGSYLVRDYARNLDGPAVTDLAGRPLEISRLDKQTWRIDHGGKGFIARYRVFADEPGVRTSAVDDRHAALNGPTLFLYLVGDTDRPAELRFTALPSGWSAHGALPQTAAGVFRAASYDALVDAPFVLGAPVVHAWDEGGARLELVFSAPGGSNGDPARIARDLQPVVRAFARAMGGLPTTRYLFLVVADERPDGGLEHADSALMRVQRDSFGSDAGYGNMLHLAAHEFFHIWNVKRLRDAALVPYDYSRENYSTLLWFHEGLTETVENQILVRAGVTTPTDYLRDLANAWTHYQQRPGRNHVPLTQVSLEAWIKHYKPSGAHHTTSVSYYEKGYLFGVCLDLELRTRSSGRGSLVGLFRRLMTSHAGRGLTLTDIVAAAGAEAGSDMTEFFRRFVEGTEELPLVDQLRKIGVDVDALSPWQAEESPLGAQRRRSYSGLALGAGPEIRSVAPGSPAERAGLAAGDELLAVARRRVRTGDEAEERLADHLPGQSVELTFFRSGRLEQRSVTIAEDPRKLYRFRLSPAVGPATTALRDAWLAVDREPSAL